MIQFTLKHRIIAMMHPISTETISVRRRQQLCPYSNHVRIPVNLDPQEKSES